MNTLKISWKNILHNKGTSFLTILLLAAGISITSLLLQFGKQLEAHFDNNIRNINLVVGATGSPTQLLLSSVYHIDNPTGNIGLETSKFIGQHPYVKLAVPISLGDNYRSYRIVGTDASFAGLYEVKVAHGKWFEQSMDVVIGHEVAQALNLKLGDKFEGSHGLEEGGHHHHGQFFHVVGILEHKNSIADHLILTPLESVWDTHAGHSSGVSIGPKDSTTVKAEEPEKEITALLVQYKSAMAAMTLPRQIKAKGMMTAAPIQERDRLFKLVQGVVSGLYILALIIVIISAVSMFISLFEALKRRKYELALMRVMGGRKHTLFWLILNEGIILAVLGFVFGLLLSHVGLSFFSKYFNATYHYSLNAFELTSVEWLLLPASIILGIVSALIPAIQAYSSRISKTLSA